MGADKQRFTTELPEHLLCEICLDVSYPPMALCAQDHIACEGCLAQIQASPSKGKCPLCQQAKIEPARPSLLLRRAVDEYRFTCRNQARGCYWTGSVADEDNHALQRCDFSYISCAFCRAVCIRHKFSERHNVCPEAMMVCPQGGRHCGAMLNGGMRKRREMQAHLDSECGNWKRTVLPTGAALSKTCETRTKRANLAQHEAVCGAAAKCVIELENRLDEQQAEISSLKKIIAKQQAKAEAFEATHQPSPATMGDENKKPQRPWLFAAAMEDSLGKRTATSTTGEDSNKRKAFSSGETSSTSASSSDRSSSASSSRSTDSSSAAPDAQRLRRSNSG
ncbi:hypothetical protein JCM10296v2_000974 [Rhodotorula toruloides]